MRFDIISENRILCKLTGERGEFTEYIALSRRLITQVGYGKTRSLERQSLEVIAS